MRDHSIWNKFLFLWSECIHSLQMEWANSFLLQSDQMSDWYSLLQEWMFFLREAFRQEWETIVLHSRHFCFITMPRWLILLFRRARAWTIYYLLNILTISILELQQYRVDCSSRSMLQFASFSTASLDDDSKSL